MTVYAKIEDNKLITAYNGYNGITGLADSPELCIENGFTAYTEEEVSGYFARTHQIIDGVLTNITNTVEYIAEQKKQKKNSAYKTYQQGLIQLKSEDELNQFLKSCGKITQSEYDNRLAIITTDLTALQSTYLTEVTDD